MMTSHTSTVTAEEVAGPSCCGSDGWRLLFFSFFFFPRAESVDVATAAGGDDAKVLGSLSGSSEGGRGGSAKV